MFVANGHRWDPKYPEPSFPGQESFTGQQLHSHHYREPDERFAGRRVLVLGIGNSAVDIAVESSHHAERTYLAMHRGAHVVPKYIAGKPVDQLGPSGPVAAAVPGHALVLRAPAEDGPGADGGLRAAQAGPPLRRGPSHGLVQPVPRLGHLLIAAKPNISRIDGDTVHFVDGTSAVVDTIVWCTGYRIRFPFLDPGVMDSAGNHVPLFRRVVHPERPGLYFIGLVQPLGAIMPIAELQSEWIADVLEGRAALPAADEVRAEIAREEEDMRRRYVASTRHTIQVDFHPYMRLLRGERARTEGVRRPLRASPAAPAAAARAS